MKGPKVVVYGLSTEGYAIACQMAIRGIPVSLIDELTPSAISLTPDIAKSYPDVSSLQEDEPILSLEPIDVAISKAQYLFFAPRIRKTGQDIKTEIHSKFKDAISALKKNSSVVYNLPTGFNGNNENISLLEHVTGFEVGKTTSYYYYPLSSAENNPHVIGSFNNKTDEKLLELLADKAAKSFVSLSSSEHYHAIDVLTHFSTLCSILEVFKFVMDKQTRRDLSSDEFKNMFFDDMVGGLYDLRSLGTSFEGTSTLMYLINGGVKGIEGYIKRLIDEIRSTLKKNDLKASRIKIALAWTMDRHEMRGDKIEMYRHLTSHLRDYIGDVESYEESNLDLYHDDRIIIVVVCSKKDLEKIKKGKKNNDLIVIKANPLCEVIQ